MTISRPGFDMRATQEKYDPICNGRQAGTVSAALRVAQLSNGRAPQNTMCPRADRTEK
jgi:hypothetical protein